MYDINYWNSRKVEIPTIHRFLQISSVKTKHPLEECISNIDCYAILYRNQYNMPFLIEGINKRESVVDRQTSKTLIQKDITHECHIL